MSAVTRIAAPRRRAAAPTESPYRGVRPYRETDAHYFFGREIDRQVIAGNLIASRLTVLHAAPGVGKSSVLRAGVEHDLLAEAEEAAVAGRSPDFLPVVVRSWSGDPAGTIVRAVEAVAARLGVSAPDGVPQGDLAGELAAWSDATEATILLILDQFEEFLLYHGNDWGPGGSADALARVMGSRDLPVHVLLAIRDDALGGLDPFRGAVPHLFNNQLRLDQLERGAGSAAIVGAVQQWNADHPDDSWEVEPELVDAVLEQVATGRIRFGRAGAGTPRDARHTGVETPFLQVVMTRLWAEETARGSRRLRLATLAALGGADALVRAHVDVRMRSLSRRRQRVAAGIFHQLVTPTGGKVARTVEDLAFLDPRLRKADIASVLEQLSGPDWLIVRRLTDPASAGPAAYEVFHDALAEPVLDWRARHEERRRVRQLAMTVAAGVVVVAVAVVLVTIFREQAHTAESARLVAASGTELGVKPIQAVEQADEAVRIRRTPESVAALRAALARADLRRELDTGEPGSPRAFRLSPAGDEVAVANSEGRVRLLPFGARRPVRLPVKDANSVEFSPDGTMLATGGDSAIEVWQLRTRHRLRRFAVTAPTRVLRWSPAGGTLLSVNRRRRAPNGSAHLWRLQGSRQSLTIGRAQNGAWSPGGSRVVTWTAAGRVRAWHKAQGRPTELPGAGAVAGVGFADRGSRVIVARERDAAVEVLGRPGCRRRPGDRVIDARVDRAGRRVVMAVRDGVSVMDLDANGGSCDQFDFAVPTQDRPNGVAISLDGRTVAVAGSDGGVRVIDVRSGTTLTTLLGASQRSAKVSMRPVRGGGEAVLAAGDDGQVRVWQVAAVPARTAFDGRRVRAAAWGAHDTIVGIAGDRLLHTGAANPLPGGRLGIRAPDRDKFALSADGRMMAAPDAAGRILVRPATKRSWRALTEPGGKVMSLRLSDDGGRVVAVRRVGGVIDRDVRSGAVLHRVPDAPGRATALPDGSTLVVAGTDIRRYTGQRGRSEVLVPARGRHPPLLGTPIALAAGRLAAMDARSRPVVWTLSSGRARPLDGGRPVRGLAFSADGAVLATAEPDRLRLWDAATGQELTTLAAHGYEQVAFSRDGRWVLAADRRRVHVFPCRPCGSVRQLLAKAHDLAGTAGVPALSSVPHVGDRPLVSTQADRSSGQPEEQPLLPGATPIPTAPVTPAASGPAGSVPPAPTATVQAAPIPEVTAIPPPSVLTDGADQPQDVM